jgi:hypothetical protein
MKASSDVFGRCVVQRAFWRDVRERRGDLWETLGMDGEMNPGAEETQKVWWERREELQALVDELDVVKPKIYVEAISRESPNPCEGTRQGQGKV